MYVIAIEIAVIAMVIVLLAARLPGIYVQNWLAALLAALVLALLNAFIKPILVFISLPLTILTLGLFMLVINAALLKMLPWFINGIRVDNWWTAIVAALVIALVRSLLNWIF